MSIRLSKEQEDLVVQNLDFVHWVVNKITSPNCSYHDYEDLVSIGTIGLIKAASSFTADKNIKFSTYAYSCIRNEIFMDYKKRDLYQKDLYLDACISNSEVDNTPITLADTIGCVDNFTDMVISRESCKEMVNIILNTLPSKKRFIMLCKLAGVSNKVIAEFFSDLAELRICGTIIKLRPKIQNYLVRNKHFDKIFSIDIVEDFYEISFSSADIKNFNKIFAELLPNLKHIENLPSFTVKNNAKETIIQVPAELESLFVIAQIIKAIDDFSICFDELLSDLQTTKLNIKIDFSNAENSDFLNSIAKQIEISPNFTLNFISKS